MFLFLLKLIAFGLIAGALYAIYKRAQNGAEPENQGENGKYFLMGNVYFLSVTFFSGIIFG